jgi:hypothetical protein
MMWIWETDKGMVRYYDNDGKRRQLRALEAKMPELIAKKHFTIEQVLDMGLDPEAMGIEVSPNDAREVHYEQTQAKTHANTEEEEPVHMVQYERSFSPAETTMIERVVRAYTLSMIDIFGPDKDIPI